MKILSVKSSRYESAKALRRVVSVRKRTACNFGGGGRVDKDSEVADAAIDDTTAAADETKSQEKDDEDEVVWVYSTKAVPPEYY